MATDNSEMSRLQALPEDLLRIIVAKIGASSPQDLCNARLSCKELKFDFSDRIISKTLKLTPLVTHPKKAKSYTNLINTFLNVENLDAHFIEGVLQLFDRGNRYAGLHHLQIASRGGHPEASYLFGVLLMCFGEIKKGKKVINMLADTNGITVVEDCWERIQVALSGFNLKMKKVYLESYNSMQPPLGCHPEEIYTVCSECFHSYLVSEFIEMVIGLNTVPTP